MTAVMTTGSSESCIDSSYKATNNETMKQCSTSKDTSGIDKHNVIILVMDLMFSRS